MGVQDGETVEPRSTMGYGFEEDPPLPEPPVFGRVLDRDLITLADVLCRAREYYSILVAWTVMVEVDARKLWPAVIDRRAHSIRLSAPDVSDGDARRDAAEQIQLFRDEHFPVEPEQDLLSNSRALAAIDAYKNDPSRLVSDPSRTPSDG